MTQGNRILALILLVSLLGLSACAYRPTIQQGNILSNRDMQSLQRGMTQREVIRTIGNPVLRNVYLGGRVVYIYTLQPNHQQMKKRTLIIYFRSGRVANWITRSSPNMPDVG